MSPKRIKLHYIEQRGSLRLPCFLPLSKACKKKFPFHHISDINLSGVSIICRENKSLPQIGEELLVECYLPGREKLIELEGEVVYVNDNLVGIKMTTSPPKPIKEYYSHLKEGKTLKHELPEYVTSSLNGNEGAVSSKWDRRKIGRKPLRQDFTIELSSKKRAQFVRGRVLDESQHGISFELEQGPGVPLPFRKGDVFDKGLIRSKDKTVQTGAAKVCHITPLTNGNGRDSVIVGLSIDKPKK